MSNVLLDGAITGFCIVGLLILLFPIRYWEKVKRNILSKSENPSFNDEREIDVLDRLIKGSKVFGWVSIIVGILIFIVRIK